MAEFGCLLDLIEPGALTVLFQPILEFDGDRWRLHALECLVRGPKGTAFENADALFEYTRRKRAESMVDRMCIAAILQEASILPVTGNLCVNVHASTLGRDPDFPSYFAEIADHYAIALSRITIEVVEQTSSWNQCRNQTTFLNALDELRKTGVTIALDDFGIGQSNYGMLIDCSPETLKLDRYIVRGCHKDKCRQAIIESVVLFASRRGAQVIAEGVEIMEELQMLMSLGITVIQGFLFFHPLSRKELVDSVLKRDANLPLAPLHRDSIGSSPL